MKARDVASLLRALDQFTFGPAPTTSRLWSGSPRSRLFSGIESVSQGSAKCFLQRASATQAQL
jgi:hypothetical protein